MLAIIPRADMESDLLGFVLPAEHRPGTDRMCKSILNNTTIMDMILDIVVGPMSKGKYCSRSTEWIDGRRGDILYAPVELATTALPPVLIEVQNTVDASFMRRLVKYCTNVFDQYHVEPIALTIAIHSTSKDISNEVAAAPKDQFFAKLPSSHWAQQHLFMDKSTIKPFLNQAPLPPVVAIAYVFMEQQVSLLGLEHKDDSTVRTIYSIAKDNLKNEIKNEEDTVDVLRTVCYTNKVQFKRMLDAMVEDRVDNKRLKSYAQDGLLYADTCLRKYSLPQPQGTDSMPIPPDLPEQPSNANANPLSNTTPTTVLRTMESESRMSDMEYAGSIVEQCRLNNKRMNWKKCFDEGVAAGYFGTYKNYASLKNTFYARKK